MRVDFFSVASAGTIIDRSDSSGVGSNGMHGHITSVVLIKLSEDTWRIQGFEIAVQYRMVHVFR